MMKDFYGGRRYAPTDLVVRIGHFTFSNTCLTEFLSNSRRDA